MLSFPVIVALHSRRPVFSIPLPLLNPVLRMLFQVPYAVIPVFDILTKTAGGVGACFPFWKTLRSRRREVALFHSSSFFSHFCALFCTHQELNSFVFKRFRTLYAKTPGGGVPCTWFNVAESP